MNRLVHLNWNFVVLVTSLFFCFCKCATAAPQPDSVEALRAGTAFLKTRVPDWKNVVAQAQAPGKTEMVSKGVKTTIQKIEGHLLTTSEFDDGAIQIDMANPDYTGSIRKESGEDDFRVVSAMSMLSSRSTEIVYPMSLQAIIDETAVVSHYFQNGDRHEIWLKYIDPKLQVDPTEKDLPGQLFLVFENQKNVPTEEMLVFKANIIHHYSEGMQFKDDRIPSSGKSFMVNELYRDGKKIRTIENESFSEFFKDAELRPEMCKLEYYGLPANFVVSTDFGRGYSWRFYTAIAILGGISLVSLFLFLRKRLSQRRLV